MAPGEFRLRDHVWDAMKMLALRAHEKGLELACQVLDDVPDALVGDPLRLRQVLVNLIGNAIKFTAKGEIDIRVEMERRDEQGCHLTFSVTDSGIGIPEDMLRIRPHDPDELSHYSVGTSDIAEAIRSAGHAIERSEVRLPNGPLRHTGDAIVQLTELARDNAEVQPLLSFIDASTRSLVR